MAALEDAGSAPRRAGWLAISELKLIVGSSVRDGGAVLHLTVPWDRRGVAEVTGGGAVSTECLRAWLELCFGQ